MTSDIQYDATTGTGGPIAVLDREIVEEVHSFVASKLERYLDVPRMREGRLSFPLKKGIDTHDFAKDISAIKGTLKEKLLTPDAFNEFYLPAFTKILATSDLKVASLATFRMRFNAPAWVETMGRADWHQDTGTWYNVDLVTHQTDIDQKSWRQLSYAIWIALVDCNETNGMDFIKGSHHVGLQNAMHRTKKWWRPPGTFCHSIVPQSLKRADVFRFCPNAGQGLLFNSLVFHRTIPNKSNELRMSIDVRCERAQFEDIEQFGISSVIHRKRAVLRRVPAFAGVSSKLRGVW